ncbi:MAG: class I SAM-dependent methyltransferase [Bryobacteraceae bacterium]
MAQVHGQHSHPPRDPEEYAKILENPERDRWQKPHAVIEALRLRTDEVVADIGAGSGYFTRRIAPHVSKVFAVDLDPKLLAKTKESSPANVEPVVAAANDPKLAPESVDTVFFCDVLHHIDHRPAYYKKLITALKPGGRVVIVDFHKRDLPVGPGIAMKIAQEDVVAEFEKAGFRLKTEHRGMLEYQYFLEFEK